VIIFFYFNDFLQQSSSAQRQSLVHEVTQDVLAHLRGTSEIDQNAINAQPQRQQQRYNSFSSVRIKKMKHKIVSLYILLYYLYNAN